MKLLYRLLVFIVVCLPLALQAQTPYPTGTITIVVGFSPGGPVDFVPRTIAAQLSQLTGVQVIVENRPGANGNIAASYVASAKPDGYTILAPTGGMVTANQWLYKKAGFDPSKALVPITIVAAAPNVLVVHPGVKAANVKELIELAKVRPGTLNYGTPGIGSSPHLAGELFKVGAGGLDILHVPYKSGPDALKDLLANRLQIGISTPSLLRPYIQSNQLRPLAVTSKVRSPLLPDVMTMEEVGLPGVEALFWCGLAAPAGTPDDVIEKIYNLVHKSLQDDGVKRSLIRLGFTIVGDRPDQTARDVGDESEKWRVLIRKLDIRLD